MATVIANPTIADQEAFPRRDASAYRIRCMKRTTAYVVANISPSDPNASGIARPAMKMNAVAASKQRRSDLESAACAFAAHTKADQAHHTSARISIARPKPAQLNWRESSVVTWAIANTNTKSHSSSTGLVRRSLTCRSLAVARRAGAEVAGSVCIGFARDEARRLPRLLGARDGIRAAGRGVRSRAARLRLDLGRGSVRLRRGDDPRLHRCSHHEDQARVGDLSDAGSEPHDDRDDRRDDRSAVQWQDAARHRLFWAPGRGGMARAAVRSSA